MAESATAGHQKQKTRRVGRVVFADFFEVTGFIPPDSGGSKGGLLPYHQCARSVPPMYRECAASIPSLALAPAAPDPPTPPKSDVRHRSTPHPY